MSFVSRNIYPFDGFSVLMHTYSHGRYFLVVNTAVIYWRGTDSTLIPSMNHLKTVNVGKNINRQSTRRHHFEDNVAENVIIEAIL